MECKICGGKFLENEIELHHIHPRFMDNPKGNGMKFNLCKKCHSILHLQIPKIIWNKIPEDIKPSIIHDVISFTKKRGGLE